MKKLVTIIAAAAAIAFVASPISANATHAKKVKCYSVKCKAHDKTCKEKGYMMTTEKRCLKMHGSLTQPATTTTTTTTTTSDSSNATGTESTGTGG